MYYLMGTHDGKHTDYKALFVLMVFIILTLVGYPLVSKSISGDNNPAEEVVSVWQVWYFGWLTAISTGLGVIPFFFSKDTPDDMYLGISNAIASGMMIAASLGLVVEGNDTQDIPGFFGFHPFWRVVIGFGIGLLFILLTKNILERYDDLQVHNPTLQAQDVQKVILIIFVMTLHSISEGIGIGVSFGGKSGSQLGQFISLSLGIHNIPEGLAVALVMRSRGATNLRTIIWCICTSLPQPIMAVPSFLFIENFEPMLAVGLGFAGGAMVYVAIFELMAEACEQCGRMRTGIIASIAFVAMMFAQGKIKGNVFDMVDGVDVQHIYNLVEL